jgi:hypothetical protein
MRSSPMPPDFFVAMTKLQSPMNETSDANAGEILAETTYQIAINSPLNQAIPQGTCVPVSKAPESIAYFRTATARHQRPQLIQSRKLWPMNDRSNSFIVTSA